MYLRLDERLQKKPSPVESQLPAVCPVATSHHCTAAERQTASLVPSPENPAAMNSCAGPARELSFRQFHAFESQRNTADSVESASTRASGEKAKAVGEPDLRMTLLGSTQVPTVQIRISPAEVAAASNLPSGENAILSTEMSPYLARFATQVHTTVRSDAFQTLTPLS